MNSFIGQALASYVRSIADWRESRYNDDLRDKRNLISADGLREFAAYVQSLPPEEPRLNRLEHLCLRGEIFDPGQQVHYEIGRFRFFSPEATIDGFLSLLVDLAEADSSERGQFGGPQIAGDNPWEESDE